jgi:hypothetical protein
MATLAINLSINGVVREGLPPGASDLAAAFAWRGKLSRNHFLRAHG